MIEILSEFLQHWYLYVPILGSIIGGSFGYSQSRSGFSNEQGVERADRQRIFGDPLYPAIRENLGFGLQDIRGASPQLGPSDVDKFGFFTSPNFNAEALFASAIQKALAKTAANQTARGFVSPENIFNAANLAGQNASLALLPQTQQNILAARTYGPEFQLQRGQALVNPLLQSGTALATGGGSGSGSSKSFSIQGSAGYG